jgi:hypothetical protein
MNPALPVHVRTTVESICELGCERVNQIIADLESGKTVAETAGLPQSEEKQVLQELRDIMSVYDHHPA